MTHEHDCPICAAPAMRPFVRFDDVPASGVFCASANEQVPRRDLIFDYCARCSFVSQRASPSAIIDYAGVTRPTARQLPAYSDAMLQRLAREGTTGLVLEVGCNDGTFLNELRRAGFDHLLGIEPSKDLAQQARDRGHAVVQEPLDHALAEEVVNQHGHAPIVVCRHTLEHVPQPTAFLAALRRLLPPGGLACIEVPSLRPIIESLHVHELWDEHISYFLPETLTFALGKAGFAVEALQVEPYREMENIVAWARATALPETSTGTPPRYAELCASFDTRWQTVRDALLQRLADSPQPIVALGASHPQSNFLNFSGMSARIHSVIDDDPYKIGRWLPLQGGHVPIQPSVKLRDAVGGGTLLLTGFGYPRWMREASGSVADCAATTLDIAALVFVP